MSRPSNSSSSSSSNDPKTACSSATSCPKDEALKNKSAVQSDELESIEEEDSLKSSDDF